jgi:hypothetical protein
MVLPPRFTERKKLSFTVSTVYMCDVMCVLRCAVCTVRYVVILWVHFQWKRERDLLPHFQKRKECIVHCYSFRGTIVDDFFDGFQIVCLEVLLLRYTSVPYELA